MIVSNKCTKCRYAYEISWNDDCSDEYYNDYEDDDDIVPDELYPEYCPFCGTHGEYDDEPDSTTIF